MKSVSPRAGLLGIAIFGSLALAGCRTAGLPPQNSSPAASSLRDTHENLHGVLWMQTSAEYKAAALAAYGRAKVLLQQALDDPAWTAAIEQRGEFGHLPPAVILDIDETVLDNSPFQAEQVKARASDFDPAAWSEWVQGDHQAAAIPGSAEFIRLAREKNVAVIFVSNRKQVEEKKTVENLRAVGIETTAEEVHLADEQGWTRDKSARRLHVAGSHRILLLVGDDLGDFLSVEPDLQKRERAVDEFASYWADRWVLLPNPIYGSWESVLRQGAAGDEKVLRQKFGSLRTFD